MRKNLCYPKITYDLFGMGGIFAYTTQIVRRAILVVHLLSESLLQDFLFAGDFCKPGLSQFLFVKTN
jgi:hypothetical protein